MTKPHYSTDAKFLGRLTTQQHSIRGFRAAVGNRTVDREYNSLLFDRLTDILDAINKLKADTRAARRAECD